MNEKRVTIVVCLIFLLGTVSLSLTGCGPGQLFGPTVTPSPTLTSTPTITPKPTLTPTITPSPTPTFTPTITPTPTAIPAQGTPIASKDWEVTVFKGILRPRLVNGWTLWTPRSGYIFLDLGVRIRRLNPSEGSVSTRKIYLYDANGEVWELVSSNVALGTGKAKDPFTIGLTCMGCLESIEGDDTYVRLFYIGNTEAINRPFILQFKDVPPIEFTPERID